MTTRVAKFAAWARRAEIGDVYWYGSASEQRDYPAFRHAMWLYDEGYVILYQQRVPSGVLYYGARRVSHEARRFIDWASRQTKAPHNPLAAMVDASD